MISSALLAASLLAAPGLTEEDPGEELPRSLSQWTGGPAGTADPGANDLFLRIAGAAGRADGGFSGPPPLRAPVQAAPDPAAPRPAGPPPTLRPTAQEFQPPHDSLEDAYDTHFSSQAWRRFVWDEYLTTPQVLLPATFAVAAGAISHWDRMLQQRWFDKLGDRGWYSDAGQYTLIGAVVLDGLLLPGEGRNWWDEAWTIGEAYGAASLTAFILKTGVKRPRPGAAPGTGNGTHSFPSGHSTSSFTAATLIEANSGPLFGVPSYLLAGFVAFERVEEGRHYPSDVLAGAAIGTLSAGIFDALHWGGAGEGGIARPSGQVSLEMGGLKEAMLALEIHF